MLQFTVVRATKLPKRHFLRTPKCYASIRVGSGQAQTTKTVKGVTVEWNERFNFDAQESSVVVVQIFDARSRPPKLKAEVTFTVAQCIQLASQNIDPPSFDLLSPAPSSKPIGGKIVVVCTPCPTGSAEVPYSGAHETLANTQSVGLTVPSTNISAIRPERDQATLETFVHTAAGSSGISTPSGIETVGVVMSTVSTTASSDSFSTVMGFVERFVQIGDAIAEVSGLHSW
jgi:hypothetical protein